MNAQVKVETLQCGVCGALEDCLDGTLPHHAFKETSAACVGSYGPGLPPPRPELVIADKLLACTYCQQEMQCVSDWLPLHREGGRLCLGSGKRGATSRCGQMIRPPLILAHVTPDMVSQLLTSMTCLLGCWGPKKIKEPFCHKCYYWLPRDLRPSLNPRTNSTGLVGALQVAIEILSDARAAAGQKALDQQAQGT